MKRKMAEQLSQNAGQNGSVGSPQVLELSLDECSAYCCNNPRHSREGTSPRTLIRDGNPVKSSYPQYGGITTNLHNNPRRGPKRHPCHPEHS